MLVCGYEHHVLDVIVGDELQERVALGRIGFEAVARAEDGTEILDRLRHHDELPGDAVVAGIEKVVLHARELDVAQDGAAWIERSGQELRNLGGVERICRPRQPCIPETALIGQNDRRIGAISVVTIEIGRTCQSDLRWCRCRSGSRLRCIQ